MNEIEIFKTAQAAAFKFALWLFAMFAILVTIILIFVAVLIFQSSYEKNIYQDIEGGDNLSQVGTNG